MRKTGNSLMGLLLAGLALAFMALIPGPAPVQASLPPRPTLTPTTPPWARIVLQAGPAYNGAWSVVQWQGGDGVWHDVEGWRSPVHAGEVRWRVTAKDFNTGPFRWAVYDAAGGQLLAVSEAFTLPGAAYAEVQVTVTAVETP